MSRRLPNPPRMRRTVHLPAAQAAAITLLAALPVAAAAGAFHQRGQAKADSELFALELAYPKRILVLEADSLTMDLRSKRDCERVALSLDSAYFEHFEDVAFTPPPSSSYVFELGRMHAGETRRLSIELAPSRPFQVGGVARATCEGVPAATRVEFETFVFP